MRVVEDGVVCAEGLRAVAQQGGNVAGLQPGVWHGEVLAAGDDDGAEPGFVVICAVGAVAREGVAGG